MFQKFFLLSLALLLSSCSVSQRSQLDWEAMGVKGVVYSSDFLINRPSSANWEVSTEYHQGKVFKQLNLRELVPPSSNHTVFAYVKALGQKPNVTSAEGLVQSLEASADFTRGLKPLAHQVTKGKGCNYDCARFEFRAEQGVSTMDPREGFKFHGLGYRFLNPTENTVYEVLFTERFPVLSRRRYSNITVESFLKSFRFDQK